MALWRGFGARSPIVLPAVSLKRVVTSPEEHDVFATRLQAVDGRGGYGERVLLLFKACPSLRRLSDRLLDFFVTRAAGTKSVQPQVNQQHRMAAETHENAQLRRRDARNRTEDTASRFFLSARQKDRRETSLKGGRGTPAPQITANPCAE